MGGGAGTEGAARDRQEMEGAGELESGPDARASPSR